MKIEPEPLYMDHGCRGCIKECIFNRLRMAAENKDQDKYNCNSSKRGNNEVYNQE